MKKPWRRYSWTFWTNALLFSATLFEFIPLDVDARNILMMTTLANLGLREKTQQRK